MKVVKIHKIQINQNILRQVIFTDTNLIIGVSLIVTFICLKYFTFLNVEARLMSAFSFIGIILILVTSRIDRQPLLTMSKRIVTYCFRIKKFRY